MGHGAGRELEGGGGPLPELDEAISAKLTDALDKLDAADAEFAEQRENERLGLMAKQWNTTCRGIDEHLRTIGKVLMQSHQLNLDIGSDGGGVSKKPFIEDLRMKFPKLQFTMVVEEEAVVARCGESTYGSIALDGVTYEYCVDAVCNWAMGEANKHL